MTFVRSRLPRATALLTLALACASDPNRLEGPDYGRDDAPFVSEQLVIVPPGPALPDAGPSLVHRVILLGDAGDPRDNEITLAALGRWGDAHAERTTVAFLGDNLYPAGLQEDDRERGEAVLRSQLDATRAARVFTPGNHDWGFPNFSADNVIREQRFIEAAGGAYLPKGGCPGPETRVLTPPDAALTRGIALVLIDLQWWLLAEDQRPDCGGMDEDEAVRRLTSELASLRDQWVIVAAHHPLRTGGPHGGLSYGALGDLIIGAMGWYFGTLQNVYEPGYAHAVERLVPALSKTRPLLYAAGHDHNLQLLEGSSAARFEVVSGAGAVKRVSTVTDIEGTLFAHAHPGFMAVDFHAGEDGEWVVLHVVESGVDAPVASTRLVDPSRPGR